MLAKKVSDLRRDLFDISPDFHLEIIQEDPSNQDFGATLVLFSVRQPLRP
jgi:hypothetical protein